MLIEIVLINVLNWQITQFFLIKGLSYFSVKSSQVQVAHNTFTEKSHYNIFFSDDNEGSDEEDNDASDDNDDDDEEEEELEEASEDEAPPEVAKPKKKAMKGKKSKK